MNLKGIFKYFHNELQTILMKGQLLQIMVYEINHIYSVARMIIEELDRGKSLVIYITQILMLRSLTCITSHSSPSGFTWKACSILYMTRVVFTVSGTRLITVATIHPMFTVRTHSTVYVTYVVFTFIGTRQVTVTAIDSILTVKACST